MKSRTTANSFSLQSDGSSARLADELVPQRIDALAGDIKPDGIGVGTITQCLVELPHETLVVFPTGPCEERRRRAIAVSIAGLFAVDLRARNFGLILPEPDVVGDSLDEPARFVPAVRLCLNDVREFMNHHAEVVGMLLDPLRANLNRVHRRNA